MIARTKSWLRYRLPPQFVRRDSSPLCIGQKQRWYLLKLGVGDSALRFDATEQPPEFDRWRWVDWWDAIHDVIYFKRRVYSRALHELGATRSRRACRPIRRGGASGPARMSGRESLTQKGRATASSTMPMRSSEGTSLNHRYQRALRALRPAAKSRMSRQVKA